MPFFVAGRKPVIEALRNARPIDAILLLRGSRGAVVEEILQLAGVRKVRVKEVDKHELDALAVGTATQGVVAVLPARAPADLTQILDSIRHRNATGFLLILDQIEDPHNLGALVRTAECAGAHGVLIPRFHAAAVTPAVIKASAGATEHIPIAEVTNIVNTIRDLKQEGFWIVGLGAEGDRLYREPDFTVPVALVVGNEGRGIRRLVKEHCDFLVRIPLYGAVGSLNASVAGALVMYEVVRAREKTPSPRVQGEIS
jgi:23S rRNA (guanosine2251-2'-O)-methyltransferase